MEDPEDTPEAAKLLVERSVALKFAAFDAICGFASANFTTGTSDGCGLIASATLSPSLLVINAALGALSDDLAGGSSAIACPFAEATGDRSRAANVGTFPWLTSDLTVSGVGDLSLFSSVSVFSSISDAGADGAVGVDGVSTARSGMVRFYKRRFDRMLPASDLNWGEERWLGRVSS